MTTPPPLSAQGCPMLHGATFAARPQVVYDQLRAAGPAGWAEIAPNVHALVVTGHRAAVTLLNDTGTYSKDSRRWQALADGYVPEDSPVLGLMGFRPSVLYADDEAHARLRWAMDDCIARISPHQLREITRRSALTLIARVIEQGRADLMTDFADTLPLYVFAELLGCPTEMSARMVRACQDLINAGPAAAQGAIDFGTILYELIQLRHQQPGQDLTSWMITHPAGLTDEESLNQLYCAVGAGVIPVAAWTGWALHLLLRDDAYTGNLASGTLTVRRALEKALWDYSPMANFSFHYARQDTQLYGVHIPAGVPVLISHAAANTDPALPPDLGYDNRSHLAWSAGPHRCPAVTQATTIAQTGIETVLDQLWDMELVVPDAEITLRHGPFHQCPIAMPVSFRPQVRSAHLRRCRAHRRYSVTNPRTEAVVLDSSGGRRLYKQTDQLRADGPAVRVRMPEDLIAWSVTRGDIAKRLLTHRHVSKDARKSWPGYKPGAIPWLYSWVDVISMFTSDGDDHKRLKQLVGRAFTPHRIEAMQPVIAAIVTDLLDALEARDGAERVDLRAEFAYGVPTRLICDLVGVPADQRPEMLRVIDAVLATDVTAEESEAIRRDLNRAMQTLIETKRRAPGEDMTSLLLAAHEEDGDRLSVTELISTLILMIGAGSETAVALIGHAVRELLTHPDQLATVLAEPTRWNDVIEETLRLHPPIMHLPLRFATEDIDLGEGVTIRAGDAILIGFGAHGRDPGVHDDPTAFDIDRADKDHLAFGHGIHYCLGAPLAKLEAQVALPALFDRFPRLTLAVAPEELVPQRSFIGNDFRGLPVILRPSEART